MIRIVIVGFGGMGSIYADMLADGLVQGIVLTGICCRNKEGQCKIQKRYSNILVYENVTAMFEDPEKFDAMLIVTPHDTHVPIAKMAFAHGKHVLCDKPLGVYTKEVKELIAEKPSNRAFAMMFQTRMSPAFQKAKEMITQGRLGRIDRVLWTCNHWFRSPAYHTSSPWRSSWYGEKGGLLINQCQHLLDIWQWLFGMPDAVDASIDFGKYNHFTVDDSVDLRFFYGKCVEQQGNHMRNVYKGIRGSFLSSSGESPGVNRLEIWGTKGCLSVFDGKKIYFDENTPDVVSFCHSNREIYASPSHSSREIAVEDKSDSYLSLLQNFSDHILYGVPLVAPGEEGLSSLMLANAAYLSAWENKTIALPLDDETYLQELYVRMDEEKQICESGENHD